MSGSSKTEQTQQSQTAPWAPQASALTDIFSKAKDAYGQSAGVGNYNGDMLAAFNPDQLSLFQKMIGAGTGAADANSATQGAAGQLIGQGSAATAGALSGLSGFNVGNGIDQNISDASKYADNPYVSGMVDASMRDANRNINENVTPSLYRAAAAGNNINNSQVAIQDAINRRGILDKTADVSSTLRGGLFSKGLDLAENGRQFNNSTNLSALLGTGSLGNSTTGTGYSGMSSALQNVLQGYGLAGAGAQGEQDASQQTINNALSKRQYGISQPFDALNQYYNLVGQNNWGSQSSGTGTTTKTPSTWEVIGGLMNAGGNMAQGAAKIAPFFSDRRLKRDISKTGLTLDNGLDVYKYNYVWDAPDTKPRFGVMADEVEKVIPAAVSEFAGYKMVDYNMVLGA